MTAAEERVVDEGIAAFQRLIDGDENHGMLEWLRRSDQGMSSELRLELAFVTLAGYVGAWCRAHKAQHAALPKGWNYCGPWKPATTYRKDDVVSFQGSAWIAKDTNVVRPNDPTLGHKAWTLMVKAGRDGKDLR